MKTKENIINKPETGKKNQEKKFLILHNDDVHSFDFVIDSLVNICNHDAVQAEQCAYIIHHKGKCDVKKGTYSYLKSKKDKLIEKGLKVTID